MTDRTRQCGSGFVVASETDGAFRVLSSLLAREVLGVEDAPFSQWPASRWNWSTASASAVDQVDLAFADHRFPAGMRCRDKRGWSMPVLFVSGEQTISGHRAARRRCAPAVFDEPGGPADLTRSLFLVAPPWAFRGTREAVTSSLLALSSFTGMEPPELQATVLGPGRYEETDASDVLWNIDSRGEFHARGAEAVHADVILDSDIPLEIVCEHERLDGWTALRVLPVLHRLGIQTSFVLVSAFGDFERSTRGRHLGHTIVIARPAADPDASAALIFLARVKHAHRVADSTLA